jgi:sugar phosphate permease
VVTRRPTLLAVLLWTMTATSFQIFVLAVLAVEIIGDLDLSRAELGLIGSINTAVGALSAPFTGRLTDRIGAWTAAIAGMVISAAGMATMAISPNALVLSLSALISGVPQGWGNPATNALIAERVAPGARGTITGIKQSGVQFGVFLSGLTLPTLALALGWRGAAWVYSGAFVAGAVAPAVFLPRRPRGYVTAAGVDPTADSEADSSAMAPAVEEADAGEEPQAAVIMDPWIWRLAGFALLMGLVGGAIGRFFPLWAEEALGMSTTMAGLLVALTGLLGIGARIVAGRVAEDFIDPPRLLRILAWIGGFYSGVLVLAPLIGSWVLWPGTLANAVGIGAWNAVAMLAIIMVVPKVLAGRASGVVMLGFLGGLSISSPVAGWVVDRWGTYQPVWVACVVLAALAVLSLSTSPEVETREAPAVTGAD